MDYDVKEIRLDTSFVDIHEDSITFSVNEVETKAIEETITIEEAFEQSIKQLSNYPNGRLKTARFEGLGKIQDISIKRDSEKDCDFVTCQAPATIGAIDYAFANHKHLVLTPSDFIILIGQGLALHINKNSEKYRHNFVEHEGKEKIVICRNDLFLDQKSDWSTIFEQFCEEIQKRIKM